MNDDDDDDDDDECDFKFCVSPKQTTRHKTNDKKSDEEEAKKSSLKNCFLQEKITREK